MKFPNVFGPVLVLHIPFDSQYLAILVFLQNHILHFLFLQLNLQIQISIFLLSNVFLQPVPFLIALFQLNLFNWQIALQMPDILV